MFPMLKPREMTVGKRCRPRIVLAGLRAEQAERIRPVLRRLGWPVQEVESGERIGRILERAPGSVVIVATEGGEESGWLVCAKLTHADPKARVVLVGPDTDRHQRLARFAGAAALVADPVEAARIACGFALSER
jgi:response regulator RpfG family c-di-GMP phosphodiesterase